MAKTRAIGYRKADFTAKDGTEVKGYNLYFSAPIEDNGKGLFADSIYLSEAKVEKLGLDLEKIMNHSIDLSYNKWGKLNSISILD